MLLGAADLINHALQSRRLMMVDLSKSNSGFAKDLLERAVLDPIQRFRLTGKVFGPRLRLDNLPGP